MPEVNGFLIAAYVVMWLGLIGYGVRLLGVFRQARRRLDDASNRRNS